MPITKKGEAPGAPEARRAMCFECMGDMLDGRADCEIVTCPIYFWQPYRKLEPDYTWRTEGSHLKNNFKRLREEAQRSKRPPAIWVDPDEGGTNAE